jgi:hypothetical protein
VYLPVAGYVALALLLPLVTLRNEPYGAVKTMIARVTNLIAQGPNYILTGGPGVPGRDELICNDLKGISATLLRVSESPETLDTVLTRSILGRYIELGGLVPTVIGYGWILGGVCGVALLSLIYGLLTGRLYRCALSGSNPCIVTCSLFGIYTVFIALQVFSPVDAFLDLGLSIIGYITVHRFLEEIMGTKTISRSAFRLMVSASGITAHSRGSARAYNG